MTLARCNLVVTDDAGTIVDGASIEVRREIAGLPLVTVYSDRDGLSALGNPFTAADGADAGFHVAGGAYKITATKDGFTRTWRHVAVGTAQEFDSDIFANANRGSVRAATTANITIATALNNGDTLDGVTLATNDRVLVKDQTAAAENGVYVVSATPARATDFDAYDDHAGALVAVEEGTVNASRLYFGAVNAGGVLGTTAIEFVDTGPAQRFELAVTLTGSMPTDGEIVEGHVFTAPMTFPAGLTGSRATCRDTATGSSVFNILKNGVTVGTVTFAIGAATGSFAMAAEMTLVAGDQVDIECPDPADATLRGIKIVLRGTP